jgi:hypothetical protein
LIDTPSEQSQTLILKHNRELKQALKTLSEQLDSLILRQSQKKTIKIDAEKIQRLNQGEAVNL